MKLTDKEAIERIKNGEIDNFTQIVDEYSPKISGYIKAKLFNKLETDDLVQNTFISFYKALFHFDDTKPVLPYLYQIARNELKMYYRSRKENVTLDENIQQSTDEPQNFFQFDYDHIMLVLNNEQKIVVKMLKDGFSYKEIAKNIKRPLNTVRTIIRRTRLRIKTMKNE